MQIKNDLAEMAKLRDAVMNFCKQNQLPADTVFVIDLCLEELITNVIKYGYEDSAEHDVQIDLSLQENLLVLEITDDGRPFDPTHIPEPDLDVPLEERRIGGLGIHLVRNYVDSMHYKREGNQNIVTLQKRIANVPHS
ncbi:ATP-binding protein [bacterium]|nr:ATP-binding protein [bacterium]